MIDFIQSSASQIWDRWGFELTKCEGDRRDKVKATWGRLQPINAWFFNGDDAIDSTTGDVYWCDQSKKAKCAALAVATPVVQTVGAVAATATRVARLLSLHHFWGAAPEEKTVKDRLVDVAADLGRIVVTPLSVAGMELASLFGLVRPYDGAKLYASFERVLYGRGMLAPCFQPDPPGHLISDSKDPSAW